MSAVLASVLLCAVTAPVCADEVVIRSAAVDSVIEAAPSHLRQVAATGGAAQRWVRTTSGGLRNVHTGQCMSGSGNYVLLRDCSAADPAQRWRFLPAGGGVMLTTEAAAEGAVLTGSRSVPNSIYGLFEPDGNDPVHRWYVTSA